MVCYGKRFALAFLLVLSAPLYADGPTAIHGVNTSGKAIALYEEWLPAPGAQELQRTGLYAVSVGTPGEKPEREFGAQRCGVREASFFCVSGGESPLAGATYGFVRDLPNCLGSLFICTGSCGGDAPAEMIRDYWECPGDDGVEYYGACAPNNQQKIGLLDSTVNLREQPDVAAAVITRVQKNMQVEILERQDECLTLNHERGQWIRVRVRAGESSEIGWIFDAYVEYTNTTPQS